MKLMSASARTVSCGDSRRNDRVDKKTSSQVFPDGIRVWMTHDDGRRVLKKEKGMMMK